MTRIIPHGPEIATPMQCFQSSEVTTPSESRSTGSSRESNRACAGGLKKKILWFALVIILAVPQSVYACAACAGRSDDAAAQGINAAVLTLLLILLVVMGGFVGCLIYLIRRAASHPLTLPGATAGLTHHNRLTSRFFWIRGGRRPPPFPRSV